MRWWLRNGPRYLWIRLTQRKPHYEAMILADSPVGYWTGSLGDVKFWNRSLSSCEIEAHYREEP